ncbi:MAG: ATP-dependent helicase, RecQ family, partial [Solirubrobacterales bacterium]|nr:ATP-dependent helicase, RecQ family [Solirubrobacterales bacterium]
MPQAPVTDTLETSALALLRELAGPQASFREHQLEAVSDLVDGRKRVLCVQRTGWGKSAVYFVATALMRRQGAGPTVLISPLLALMRNQIAAAERLGITAVTVNSTNREDWDAVRRQLEDDSVDLLLISPERLNNPQFRETMLPLFIERVGLLVVDEAHCVSDWGHDFRPDYRRIGDVLAGLSGDVAVLFTTATANDRVVADVSEQLRGAGGDGHLTAYRGALARRSLRLEVCDLPNPAARLAWLATWLPRLPGSGIVYCLTKRDTDTVAEWLNSQGISALAYSGEVADEDRVEAERRLLGNEVKAVVATSALGMGYDKPDLGFVVHYQAPSSAIAYYQQVGRAGRAVDEAHVILLRGAEDRAIQDFFIQTAFPRRELVDRVLEVVGTSEKPATLPQLQAEVNLGRGRIEAMLKVLDVEGAVRRDVSGWVATGRAWVYDAERYEQVTALRRAEQRAMAAFGQDGRCLMMALQQELDDPAPEPCGRCSVCTAPRFDGPLDEDLIQRAARVLRSQPVVLAVRRQTPRTADQPGRKIAPDLLLEEGRALARSGDGGWDPRVQEGRRSGRFDDDLVAACAELVGRWGPRPAPRWVAAVPSLRSGALVPDFACRLAEALGLGYVELVRRRGSNPPQREMANSSQQVANVRGQFEVAAQPPGEPGLLVDDIRSSGWTLATVGAQLRMAGAGPVHPLVLSLAGA